MSVVYFLILVGVLVSVHELGHFIAAKALDVKVLRLSLGFGPAIARLQGRDTEYQLGIIPLGGYVRLLGEEAADTIPEAEQPRSFGAKPLWRRLTIVLAGPAANLICPIFIFLAFFGHQRELPAAVVGDVLPGGPAATADIRPGDRVVDIDGEETRYWEQLEAKVSARAGHELRLRLRRGASEFSTYVTPRRHVLLGRDGTRTEHGMVGITKAPFQPKIGVLDVTSAAARAGLRTGDLVVSIDGLRVSSWTELERAVRDRPRRATIAYLRPRRVSGAFGQVRLLAPGLADLVPEVVLNPEGKGTIEHGLFSAEFFLARVDPGSPADQAGMRPGDLVVSLDGEPVTHWMQFDQALQAQPEHAFEIRWLRSRPDGGVDAMKGTVTQVRRPALDEFGHEHQELVFGAHNDFRLGPGVMVPIEGRFLYTTTHALGRTVETVVAMFDGFGSLLSGDMPRGVGGPIMMYRIASVSGAKGWDSFLLMLALVSVNLGLINLLPIPTLDGGHLLVFAMEGLGRHHFSARVRTVVTAAGLLLIVALTILALRNDVVRYLLQGSGGR